MRITFVVAKKGLSGGNRVAAMYAQLMSRRGHDVTVVVPAARPVSLRENLKRILKGARPALPGRNDAPSHFDMAGVPVKVLDRHRPVEERDVPDADVIIAHWWQTANWVAAMSQAKGRKVYFVQHHEVHEGLPLNEVQATYRLPLHKITISEWLVDVLKTEYGDDSVFLVPNSVDTDLFTAPERSKQTTPTFGLMYSLQRFKGCDIVARAIDIAAASRPDIAIIAFGAVELSDQIRLPPNVEYFHRPSQQDLKNIYSRCDAWLFASRTEGFGLPLLEAMACRTPVIGTPAGAAPELLAHDRGILVPPEDPAAMAEAMIRVAEMNDAEWKSMSDRAFRKATAYSWEDAADLYEAALLEIVRKKDTATAAGRKIQA